MKIDGKNIWPFISGIIIFSAINFYFCFSIGPKIFAAVINFIFLLLPALHFIRLAVSPFHFGSLPKIGCREK